MTVASSRDKAQIRRSFAAAAGSYDGLAMLQRQVGLELLRRYPLRQGDDVLLDVGCGTGFLSHQLASAFAGRQLLALDIALPMLQTCRGKYPAMRARYLCGDAEKLPFIDNAVDQIYSNLALQWMQDLSIALVDFQRVLKNPGRLVFATFGPKTLSELKAAWAAVDDYAHVNTFCSADDIAAFLQAARFSEIDIDTKLYRLEYPSVESLMRELKGIGAHTVSRGRNPGMTTKTQLRQMIEHYRAQTPAQTIVASYEIIFVRAGTGA